MCLIFVPWWSFSQTNIIISGQLVDAQSGLPVEYATIRIAGKPIGTSTDNQGGFLLTLNKKINENTRLICSAVGYTTIIINLNNNPTSGMLIRLSPTAYLLDEVVISPREGKKVTPGKIVRLAIKNLTKTCPPYKAIGDYQHFIKENGIYKKITEGKISINDPVGYGKRLAPVTPREMVTFIEKRQSIDNSIDRIDFKRGYFNTYQGEFRFLLHNGLKYKFGSDDYLYTLEDTLYSSDHITYIINAKDKEGMQSTDDHLVEKFDMKFYIEENAAGKFSIVRFELNYQVSIKYDTFTQSDNRTFTVDLQKTGDHYQPKVIEHLLIQNTKWDNNPEWDGQIMAYHKIDIEEVGFRAKNSRIVPKGNSRYNSSYWKTRPLDNQMVKDLSSIVPLHKQFVVQDNRQAVKQMQDSISHRIVKDQLAQIHKKSNILIVVWDNWQTPLAFNEFQRWLKYKDLKLFFIGKFNSNSDWAFTVSEGDFMFFRQYNLPYSWHKVLKEGKRKKLPRYVLIKKNGQRKERDVLFSKDIFNTLE